jgi:hypothetical protein
MLHENHKKCKKLAKNAIFLKRISNNAHHLGRRSENNPHFPIVLERVRCKVLTSEEYCLTIDDEYLPHADKAS